MSQKVNELRLSVLVKDSKLTKLLEKCQQDHELILTECNDGAIIFECYDCPFHHLLDDEEERVIRAQIEEGNEYAMKLPS